MASLVAGKPGSPGFDILDLVRLRIYYESLRGEKKNERSTWDGVWAQLAAYFEPWGTRFDPDSTDEGYRKDYEIINEEGMLALDVLSSGMLTGMANPTLEWFRIGLDDETLNKQPAVRQWCEAVQKILRDIFVKSNFYQVLQEFFRQLGLYGTSAFLIEEDRDPDPRRNATIRCIPYPIGEYTLGLDEQLRQDLSIRELSMSVRQVVDKYGYDNVSSSTQTLYDSPAGGVKENRRTIIHVIHRDTYFGSQVKRLPPNLQMPWISSHYELNSWEESNAILQRKGYFENPLISGRWWVVGENTYGFGAAWRVLGSNKSVQAYEDRQAFGIDWMSKPTWLAGAGITSDARKALNMPGDVIYTDLEDVTKQLIPAGQLNWGEVAKVIEEKITTITRRIQKGLFTTAFQAITDLDRKTMTAEETRARVNEQIQILGPVVERQVEESLSPSVIRTLGIAYRKGKLPPMPTEMHGQVMRLNFESILAAAQRQKRATNITAVFTFVNEETPIFQRIADNFDADEAARELADVFSIPNKIIMPEQKRDAMRAQQAQQAQQSQQADNAQKFAAAAKSASATPVGDGSQTLLDKTMATLPGGAQ